MTQLLLPVLVLASAARFLLAQAPSTPSPDPLELVARAEQLCTGPQKEDAILVLWDALELLRARAEQPASAACITAALGLLETHDPLHGDRLAAFTGYARKHVELAALYRGKKWLVAAAECLDIAERFDPAATAKERAQLAAAWAKSGEPPPSPAPKPDTLLQRKATVRVDGPWQEGSDTLECGPHPANTPWYEWVLDAHHGDCELSVEFRSVDPKAPHDCGLLVGVDGNSFRYQVIAAYYAEQGRYELVLFEHTDKSARRLGQAWVGPMATPDGFHRLTLRVHGKSVRGQLDSAPPIDARTSVVPRGRFGLTVGLNNQQSAAITLRNLQSGQWPPLTEEQLRADAEAAAQQRIAAALDSVASLLARKEAETAAVRLRKALLDAGILTPGKLRSSLTKSIEVLLPKTDLLHSRRCKVDQEGARALVALADRYAAAGQVRAAHRLIVVAADIDAEGCAARLALAREAVEAWQKDQDR